MDGTDGTCLTAEKPMPNKVVFNFEKLLLDSLKSLVGLAVTKISSADIRYEI